MNMLDFFAKICYNEIKQCGVIFFGVYNGDCI